MVEAVRRVLPNIKASSTPPYRLLLEAVGLPVPAGGLGNSPFNQPQPQRNNSWQQPQIQQMGQQPGYYGHQAYGYAQPMAAPTAGSFGLSAMNLSPLLVPQNMPIGPAMRGGSPSLRGGRGSPRTPQHGRRDAGGQMMSPASDPFNPVRLVPLAHLNWADFSLPRHRLTCHTCQLVAGSAGCLG